MRRDYRVTERNLVIDTNILLLLIGYQHSVTENHDDPTRDSMLYEIWGRGHDLPRERFDDLWNLFKTAEAGLSLNTLLPRAGVSPNAWRASAEEPISFGVEC